MGTRKDVVFSCLHIEQMGFFSDLWEGIKTPFKYVYDKIASPVVNTISGIYDRVKGFLPAPLRAIGDTVQGTVKQVQSGIDTARQVAGAVGLKDGGQVLKEKMEMMEPKERKYYQAM